MENRLLFDDSKRLCDIAYFSNGLAIQYYGCVKNNLLYKFMSTNFIALVSSDWKFNPDSISKDDLVYFTDIAYYIYYR